MAHALIWLLGAGLWPLARGDVVISVYSPLMGVHYMTAEVLVSINVDLTEGPLSDTVRAAPEAYTACFSWGSGDGGGSGAGEVHCCSILDAGACTAGWPSLITASAAPGAHEFTAWLQRSDALRGGGGGESDSGTVALGEGGEVESAAAAAAAAESDAVRAGTLTTVRYATGPPPLPLDRPPAVLGVHFGHDAHVAVSPRNQRILVCFKLQL